METIEKSAPVLRDALQLNQFKANYTSKHASGPRYAFGGWRFSLIITDLILRYKETIKNEANILLLSAFYSYSPGW
jgi:hypothetical protein